jgi:acyl-CoA reductase-like NAD-dependent aldehyde dehydrogenase
LTVSARRLAGAPGPTGLIAAALGARQCDRIVTETVASGASVHTGGTHEQLYYRPTVLADVTPGTPAFREEIFGPVAPVVVVKDVDEAVRTANATEYGLVAAIHTGSMERGLEIAERLNTGIVHVNDQTLNNDAYAPFGGTGASGKRQPVRLAEQLGRIHPVAVGHRPAAGARLPVLTRHPAAPGVSRRSPVSPLMP